MNQEDQGKLADLLRKEGYLYMVSSRYAKISNIGHIPYVKCQFKCLPGKTKEIEVRSLYHWCNSCGGSKIIASWICKGKYYLDWLANAVMVKKPNGKWWMCVDFTNLKKACPNHSYPLPTIDRLMDSSAGHKVLSFMDAFLSYNQILMNSVDQEKTSFISEKGTYLLLQSNTIWFKERGRNISEKKFQGRHKKHNGGLCWWYVI